MRAVTKVHWLLDKVVDPVAGLSLALIVSCCPCGYRPHADVLLRR